MASMTSEYGILRFLPFKLFTLFSSGLKCLLDFQLISYAGYLNADGTFTGDPANVEITDVNNCCVMSIIFKS